MHDQAPATPSTPAAEGRQTFDRKTARKIARAILVDFVRFCSVLLLALAAAVLVVEPQVQHYLDEQEHQAAVAREAERQAREIAEAQVQLLVDQLRELKALHEIATPPTNDKLFTILSKGVGVTEDVLLSTTVGTTPAAAFATDLTTVQQSDAYTQEITIINAEQMVSGTKNLCFKPIAWATAGATCTLKCAGSTITCTGGGTSTDGIPLLPGQGATRRYDGTSCICVVGSAASTDVFTERVLR